MVEAWYDPTNNVVSTDKNDPRFTPLGQLWRLVPEREWVDLTDEDIAELHNEWAQGNLWDGWNYERAIEAKVKERNNA
jgi:hypothetical protein